MTLETLVSYLSGALVFLLGIVQTLYASSMAEYKRTIAEKLAQLALTEQRLRDHELSDAAAQGKVVTRDYLDAALKELRDKLEEVREMVRDRLENSSRHRLPGGGGGP